jgi:hypothetical protein
MHESASGLQSGYRGLQETPLAVMSIHVTWEGHYLGRATQSAAPAHPEETPRKVRVLAA